ncbi:MAG: PQQ-binding-like beta-propeller repeat protein [Planctomycetaceae bacterium]
MNPALILVLTCCLAGSPDAWPAFLGQGASAVDPASIPLNWSPTENIAWTAKIPGKGQSSPVIWGDSVFVTSIEGSMKDKCHLVALSLTDGHELWRKEFESPQTTRSNYFQSRSAPTPVVDGERVYAFFETGILVACSQSTGEVVWQRSLTEEYGAFESNIGLAASPILVNGTLAVLIDHEGPSYLLGVNPQTGENLWKTDRTSRTSYASPSAVTIAGKPQIVCSSAGSIDGYDPQTGETLWTYEEKIGGNRSGAALQISDGTFAIGASPGMHNEKEEEAKNTNFVMHVEKVDGKFVPKVQWKTDEAMPSFNSPIAHNGYAYWVNKVGVVYCFNLQTGEKCYTSRTNGICWATPVGLGDRVYLFGKDGKTTVLATGPEFKILAENQLWDPDKVGDDNANRARGRRSRGGTAGGGHGGGEHKESQPAANGTPSDKATTPEKPAETPPAAAPTSTEKTEDKPTAKPDESAAKPSTTKDGHGEGPHGGGRLAMTDKEREANRAAGENRFADPVQYGVAIVNGSLVIRSGEMVYCVRNGGSSKTAAK